MSMTYDVSGQGAVDRWFVFQGPRSSIPLHR